MLFPFDCMGSSQEPSVIQHPGLLLDSEASSCSNFFVFSRISSEINYTNNQKTNDCHTRIEYAYMHFSSQNTSRILVSIFFQWRLNLGFIIAVSLLFVSAIGAAITKCHRLGGSSTTEIYCLQFWRLEAPGQGARRSVRAPLWSADFPFLTVVGGTRELCGVSCKNTNYIREDSTKAPPHTVLIPCIGY